jgi:hypothetical protein
MRARVNLPIRQKIEFRVVELPIDSFDRQPFSASLMKKVQIHVGTLHYAYLLT